jgi:hypothetical protein
MNAGEAAKRAITASFFDPFAAASLSNSQQSAVELQLRITDIKTESILHGSHLQDFLNSNIMRFIEANPTTLGNKLRGTQRMALGFVAKCTKAKIVMKQTVEKTSSNQAHGRAGADVHVLK